LIVQKTGIFDSFDKMVREKKIDALGKVMGLEISSLMARDGDNSNYELTLDNSLKMMAIYLRFKANIPVIIMGETGCGKTSIAAKLAAESNFPFVKLLSTHTLVGLSDQAKISAVSKARPPPAPRTLSHPADVHGRLQVAAQPDNGRRH